MDDAAALRQAIAALESRRGLIGSATVDAALGPLRKRLAQLGASPGPQLRQVSVLFVDVADSTAMNRELDPEDVHHLMDGALQRFTVHVQAAGGRVLQYAGDCLLAAFGTPAAHEDDAERAVDAALAVLAEARAIAAEQAPGSAAARLAVRAGIATGAVLLGGGVEGDDSIRGAVVNLAARMEQNAPPGGLRICPDTRRLVRGLFELHPEPPLALKGYDEPMATWLVQRRATQATAQAARGVGGVPTPMIGRQGELAALQQAFQARLEGEATAPAVVVLLGEGGLGKSRLASEFRAWAKAQHPAITWLQAQASERAMGEPYGLLRQLFMRHLGLLDSDSAADARRAWLAAMAPLLAHEGDAAVLGHLLGLDFAAHPDVRPLLAESRQLRDRGFFHARQALHAMTHAALALFIDDLHWADAGTLEFIEHLQREATGLRLLLCSARPALELRRPGWAGEPGRLQLELAPLSGADASTLAAALLVRLPQAPTALHRRLIDGAEGNPFYMEELLNMLIDRGVIVDAAEGWRLGERTLDDTAMPRTLAGVLQARLDELDAHAAHALQLAAVVGPVFWADALRALGVGEPGVLPALLRRQFIVEQPAATLAGQREYAFRHHLLHQVCYERVLRSVKVPAHAQVAKWLAAQPGERPLDLIAEHHERGREPELALAAWHRAAESAKARYANEQALAHARRALVLAPTAALELRFALTYLRVEVLGLRADDQALEQELLVLDELAERMNDDGRRAQAALRRAVHLEHRGDIATSLRLAEGAWHQVATRWPGLAARAGRVMATALGRLGRNAQARPWAEASLGLARESGEVTIEGALLNELAGLELEDGDPAQAVALYEQALVCHRQVGQRSHEAGVLSNLGYVDLGLGHYERASARFAEARTLASGIGQPAVEGMVLINLALAELHGGHAQQALDHAEAARSQLQACGSRWAEAAALRVMGQCDLALGQAARAGERLADARQRFESLGLKTLAVEASASLAQARLAVGAGDEALALVNGILQELDKGTTLDGCEEPMRVHLACWQVLQAAGDERAASRLQFAQAQLQARAARVNDPAQRESLLHRVPHHRALLHAGGA